MKKTAWMAIAVVVLAGGVACSQAKKSGPEAALDRAYQSGILSRDEYEAKKAALGTSAAMPVNAPVAAGLPVTPVAPAPAPAAPAPAAAAPIPAAPSAPGSSPVTAKPPVAAKPPATAAPVALPAEPAAQPVETPQPVAPPVNPTHVAAVPVRPAPAARDEERRESVPPAACEDSEVRPGKEKGKQERFYPMPPSKVRAALLKALNELDFDIHRATDTEIEASRKRHVGLVVGHGGEKVTLSLEEATEGHQRGTRVAGETKKSFVMRAGQKSWTNAVLDQAGCTLHTSGRAAGLEHGKGTGQSTY